MLAPGSTLLLGFSVIFKVAANVVHKKSPAAFTSQLESALSSGSTFLGVGVVGSNTLMVSASVMSATGMDVSPILMLLDVSNGGEPGSAVIVIVETTFVVVAATSVLSMTVVPVTGVSIDDSSVRSSAWMDVAPITNGLVPRKVCPMADLILMLVMPAPVRDVTKVPVACDNEDKPVMKEVDTDVEPTTKEAVCLSTSPTAHFTVIFIIPIPVRAVCSVHELLP